MCFISDKSHKIKIDLKNSERVDKEKSRLAFNSEAVTKEEKIRVVHYERVEKEII